MSQDRRINNNIYPAPNEPEEGEILAPCDIIQNKFDNSFNLNQKMNSTDCKIITYKNPFIPASQSLGVISNSGQIIKDQDFGESKNFQPVPFMGSYGQGSMFQTDDYNLDVQQKGYEKEYAQNEHEEPEPESVEDNQDKEFYENRQNKFYEEICDYSIAEEQEEELEVIDDRQRLKVPQPNFGHSGEEAELAEHESDQNINGDDTVSHDEVPKSRPIGIDFGVMSPNAGLNNDMVHDYSENSQQEQSDFINDSQSSPSCQYDNEYGLNNLNQYNNFYQQKPEDSDMEKQPFNKNESFQSVEKLNEDQKQNFSQDQPQKIENSEELDDEHQFKVSEVPEFIPATKDLSQVEESQVTGSKQKPQKTKVIQEATRKSVRNSHSFQSKQNQKQETESQFEVPEIVLEESVQDIDKEFQNLDSKTGRSLRSRKNIDYSEQKSFNKTPGAKGLTEKAKAVGNILDATSEKSDAKVQTSKKKKQKEIQDFSDVLKEEIYEQQVKQSVSRRGGSSKKSKIVSERQSSRRSKRISLPEIQEEEPFIDELQNQASEEKLKNSQKSATQQSDYESMTLQQQEQILEQLDDKIPDVKLVSQRKSQIKESNILSNSQNEEDENDNNVSDNQNIYELQNIDESDEEENLEPYWKQPEEDYEDEKENQESNDIDDESSENPRAALPIVQLSSSESSNNLVDEEMSESAPNKYSEKQIDYSAEKYNAFEGIDFNENNSKIEGQSSIQVGSEQSATGNKLGFRQIGPGKIQLEAKSSIDEDQSNNEQQQFLVKSSISEESSPNSNSEETLLDQEIIDQLQNEDREEQDEQNQDDEVEDDGEWEEDNKSKSEQTTEEEQDSLMQDDQEKEEKIEPNQQSSHNSPQKQNNIEKNLFQNNNERLSAKSYQKLFSLQRGKAKTIQKLSENQEEDQKKRGRPKKDEIKQQQQIQVSQDDQANKKRGRPKKSNEDQKVNDDNEQILESQEIKKEGKKRGRPSVSKDKNEEAKIQKNQLENFIQDIKEIKEDKKESTPKKRGRGKKQKDEEKQEVVSEIKKEEEIVKQLVKGKRGQKAKENFSNQSVDEAKNEKFQKQKSPEKKEFGFGFQNSFKQNEVGMGEKLVQFGFGFTGPESDRMENSSEQFELPYEKVKTLQQSKKVKQFQKKTDPDIQARSVSKGPDPVLQRVKQVSKGTGPDLNIQKIKSVSKGTDPVLQRVKSVSKGTDPDPKISFQLGFTSPLKGMQDSWSLSPSKVKTFNKVSQTQNNLSRSVAVQVVTKSQTLAENKFELEKPSSKIPQIKSNNKVEEQRPPSKISQFKGNKVEAQKSPSKISQVKAVVSQNKKSDLRSGLRSQQIEQKEGKLEDVEKVKSKERKRKASPIQKIEVSQPQKPSKSSSKTLGSKKVEQEEKHSFGLRSGPKLIQIQSDLLIEKPSDLPQKRKREIKQEEKKVNKTINLQIGQVEDQQRSTRNTPQNIPNPQIKPKKVIDLNICKCSINKRNTRENPKINCPGNCCKNTDCLCNIQIKEQIFKSLPKPSPQKASKRSFSLRSQQEEHQPAAKKQQKKIEKLKEQKVMQTRKVLVNLPKTIEIKEVKKQDLSKSKKPEKFEKVQKSEKPLNLQKAFAGKLEKVVKLEKLQNAEKVQKLEMNIGKGNKKKQEIAEPEPEKPSKRNDKKEIEKESERVTRNGRGRPSKKGSPIKAVILSVQKENKVSFGLFEPKQLKESKQSKEPKQLKDKSIKIKKTATLRISNMNSALGFVTKEKRQPKYKM